MVHQTKEKQGYDLRRFKTRNSRRKWLSSTEGQEVRVGLVRVRGRTGTIKREEGPLEGPVGKT